MENNIQNHSLENTGLEKLKQQKEERLQKQLKKEQYKRYFIRYFIPFCLYSITLVVVYFKGIEISNKLDTNKKVDASVAQLSMIIDNVKNAFVLNNNFKFNNIQDLLYAKIIPLKAIAPNGRKAVNLFGGNILVEQSKYIENKKEGVFTPTFKISYEKLPRDVCISMVSLDWGNKNKGLLAISAGVNKGRNNAIFEEIDKSKDDFDEEKLHEKNRIFITSPTLIARPNSAELSTPVSTSNARRMCKCKNKDNCSMSLLYAVYLIDKPLRIDSISEVGVKR